MGTETFIKELYDAVRTDWDEVAQMVQGLQDDDQEEVACTLYHLADKLGIEVVISNNTSPVTKKSMSRKRQRYNGFCTDLATVASADPAEVDEIKKEEAFHVTLPKIAMLQPFLFAKKQ